MHNIQPAYIFDPGNNLLEEPARFLLFDSLYLHDIVEKLASTRIFHDKIQFFLGFNDFIELHHLRMPNDLEDVDFSGNSLNICDVDNFAFLENFNGHFFLGKGVSAQFHFTEGALANRLTQNIVTDCLIVLEGL